MRHILIIKTAFWVGGIERSLIEFLRHLDYSRYQVDLLLLYGPDDLCPELAPEVNLLNVDKLGSRVRRHPLYLLYYLLSVFCRGIRWKGGHEKFRACKRDFFHRRIYSGYCRREYDVALAYQQSFACEFLAKYTTAKKKLMMYHHGEIEDREYLEPWFRQADCVIGVSREVGKKLQEAFPFLSGRTAVIENYEDAETIRHKSEEYQPDLAPAGLCLCTCGRLSFEKGFDFAIQAACLLKKKNIPFHWYFVGGGYDNDIEASIYRQISEAGLAEEITVTGFLANPFPYIRLCDILVVPSRFEANPMILHEGKILRKVMVATRTKGALELLRHNENAYLCDISGEAIAEAIQKLLASEEIRRKFVAALPGYDTLAARNAYYAQWEELLNDKP